jgi:hypothetical protein
MGCAQVWSTVRVHRSFDLIGWRLVKAAIFRLLKIASPRLVRREVVYGMRIPAQRSLRCTATPVRSVIRFHRTAPGSLPLGMTPFSTGDAQNGLA